MLRRLRDHGTRIALGVLIVVNVVLLSALLVRQQTISAVPAANGSSPPQVGSAPSVDSSPSPAVDGSSSPTPSAAASSAPDRPAPEPTASPERGPTRLLAANSSTTAWRATQGSCRQRSDLEVTTDGGRTWRAVDAGIRGIVRLRSYGASSVFAVGTDRDCRPTYAWTDRPSGSWRQDRSVMWDVWYTLPGDQDGVHAPGGTTSRPCGSRLQQFAATPDLEAAAVCEDGRVRTMRPGASWRTEQSRSGAVALAADDEGFLLAQFSEQCEGLEVRRFEATGAGLRGAEACARDRGQVAIAGARSGDAIWIWRDDTVTVTGP